MTLAFNNIRLHKLFFCMPISCLPRHFRATRLLTESLPIIVPFLTRRPFSAQMVHSCQPRVKQSFQSRFSRRETTIFRSPDGWLSKRLRVSPNIS